MTDLDGLDPQRVHGRRRDAPDLPQGRRARASSSSTRSRGSPRRCSPSRRRSSRHGHTVVMPHLFGTPGAKVGPQVDGPGGEADLRQPRVPPVGERYDDAGRDLVAGAGEGPARGARRSGRRGGRHVLHRRLRARDAGRRTDRRPRPRPAVGAVRRDAGARAATSASARPTSTPSRRRSAPAARSSACATGTISRSAAASTPSAPSSATTSSPSSSPASSTRR